MGATPSSAATRRMVTGARPSASATAIAAWTIRSRVSPWSPPRGSLRRVRMGAGAGAGAATGAGTGEGAVAGRTGTGSGSATTVPAPGREWTRPSWRRVASTLVAVAIATPHSWVIARVDGTRSPGFRVPAAIRPRSSAAIRR